MSIHIARTRFAIGDGLADRILATLDSATEDDWVAGSAWYHVAHEIAEEIAPHGVGAAVLAALSPQVGWAPNIAAAQAMVMGEDPQPYGVLGPNIVKAQRILDGERPFDVLGGNKVRNFCWNIQFPDDHGHVTVDRHALNIALVGPGNTGADHRLLARKGGYQLVAAAYRAAARSCWLVPNQLQAITWLTHRRLLDERATGNLAKAHIAQRRNI